MQRTERKQLEDQFVESGGRYYCQPKWIFGFLFVLMGPICQSIVLPFLDLTLIACNSATAIIANVILSTKILGEQFIWKYDLTAMLLIATGVVLIVLKAHTEPVSFSGEEIYYIMISWRMLAYIIVLLVSFFLDRFVLVKML